MKYFRNSLPAFEHIYIFIICSFHKFLYKSHNKGKAILSITIDQLQKNQILLFNLMFQVCFDKYLNHKKIVFLSKEANVNQRLNLKKQGFKFSTQLFMVFNFLEFSLHHFIICLY
ncbi:hypothetical protein pb186bvf_010045 [Paramecium bursaria]